MAHITQLATVIVPVSDQDRAIAFYVDALGFEKRLDFSYDTGERWIEVVPPGAATSLTLVASDTPGVETGVILLTTDVEGDHAAFAGTGIEVGQIMRAGHPVTSWAGAPLAGNPPMFVLADPDGNSLLVVASS
jgi:catechol 2,3-dioxygenase-like lactoylglutathione lyase family enzyme